MLGRLRLQRKYLIIHHRTSSQSNTHAGSRSDSEFCITTHAIQISENVANFGVKEGRWFFSRRDVPINFNFPNKRGIPGYDPEAPLSELLRDLPKFVQDQAKALSLWRTGCDSDWNEGFSTVQFVPTDNNTAIFKGKLCTEVVKDGRVERAGWATIKLEDYKALNRKKFLRRWRNFSHLLIKGIELWELCCVGDIELSHLGVQNCRGDGRSYKVMLHAPRSIDLSWGDSFSYPLHTRGGPYWQYEKIPFSKFFHTVAGRIQDKQYAVNLEDVSSIGIVLMDRIDGEFQLELDYIGVYNDRAHFEKFAYETYTLPLFNTHGI
ncbi:Complex I intermediate-associated protein 30 [Dictyocaulus viviparus]|uniref:Complex I intermediate-associated protein 30 n=1 Tax=Dictyocaulus viviparus TaxID=29172 RepID=A0A0D8XJH6_DICVI|nr:Complex I intermediate-associated protein 30 [Dictyocaulus viviparus]